MFNIQRVVIEKFTTELEDVYRRNYGLINPSHGALIAWAARLSLENIGNSDMLYHDVEHTMLVTSVGQQILVGKHLREGAVSPDDWLNFVLALLFHDIGYVRGVCRADRHPHYATGEEDKTIELPEGATDAALTPFHVSRSQLFVRERFGSDLLTDMHLDSICSFIEMTRFPPPKDPKYQETGTYAGLARAADFIGQLGDPNYLRKVPSLFYEFEQLGMNAKLGYKHPEDMRNGYAAFFWKVVRPYLNEALNYLHVTHEGRQWIANLQSQVFSVEHPLR
jgi:hypothetical protein